VLRFLSDENFNGDIVRVQDVAVAGADDPEILAWAAENNRVLLTHDQATMPDFAYARIAAGQPMPGVFVLSDRLSISQCIEELLLIDTCSEQAEWTDLVLHLPL
jgi:predicted nuclease of predicted toxin-antitoxin system